MDFDLVLAGVFKPQKMSPINFLLSLYVYTVLRTGQSLLSFQ